MQISQSYKKENIFKLVQKETFGSAQKPGEGFKLTTRFDLAPVSKNCFLNLRKDLSIIASASPEKLSTKKDINRAEYESFRWQSEESLIEEIAQLPELDQKFIITHALDLGVDTSQSFSEVTDTARILAKVSRDKNKILIGNLDFDYSDTMDTPLGKKLFEIYINKSFINVVE